MARFLRDELTPILRVARQLFAQHGYHATSIRSIAKGAGLSVPGLYYHYESKQEILDALVTSVMNQMLAHTHAADRESDGTAAGRFNNVVECLLYFHMWRRDDAFVASTEMRSMAPDVRQRHITQRDEQQDMLAEIIQQGIEEQTFACTHVKEASRAIASLCVSVSSWYRPNGSLSADLVAKRYLEIAARVAGILGTEAAARTATVPAVKAETIEV